MIYAVMAPKIECARSPRFVPVGSRWGRFAFDGGQLRGLSRVFLKASLGEEAFLHQVCLVLISFRSRHSRTIPRFFFCNFSQQNVGGDVLAFSEDTGEAIFFPLPYTSQTLAGTTRFIRF